MNASPFIRLPRGLNYLLALLRPVPMPSLLRPVFLGFSDSKKHAMWKIPIAIGLGGKAIFGGK